MEKLTFEQCLDRLRERIVQPDFLANRGLGNEVGFYIFQYAPERELELRAYLDDLKSRDLPCRIREYNLWQAVFDCCEAKGILNKIPALELKRGSEALLDRLQTIATPEVLINAMNQEPRQPGDVIFITGVGEAYPLVRAHQILEAAQPVFGSSATEVGVPLVVFYPGAYDGQSLSLFGRLPSVNYYRAFDLI